MKVPKANTNELLTIYKNGYHYKNKRKKSEILVSKRKRKNIYDISFIRKNHEHLNITKEDLVNIEIDESTNSSKLSISLGYNALLIIHQIVEHIENQKELKKLKKNWKKGETITFEYKHIK